MSARLARITDWQQVAKAADFHPAKMAALCFISERQLQRYFHVRFQMTPREWLRRLQCELAKALISQGYSTKAAALELKFTDEPHFCREFKKFFGVPPQTFAPTFSRVSGKMSLRFNNVVRIQSFPVARAERL